MSESCVKNSDQKHNLPHINYSQQLQLLLEDTVEKVREQQQKQSKEVSGYHHGSLVTVLSLWNIRTVSDPAG